MKAVVLLGGEGTRLRPLTYTTPKQLLPVAEEPLLQRVLAHLASHGVDRAVLSLGYRPDAFLAAYPDARCAGVSLEYAVEPTPLDTAGAIRFAAQVASVEETFIVVNGDVLTDVDLGALISFHSSRQALATVQLTAVADPSRFGVVPVDAKGKVIEFVEKPPPGTAPTNLVNAGTYVLQPEVLDAIPDGRPVSIERETFPTLAEKGLVYAMASDAYWLDTGTPRAYLQANFDLLDSHRPVPPAAGARRSGAGFWELGHTEVHGEVSGAALVGSGVVVARGAVVRRSVLGAGTHIESGAVVEGSVLLCGVRVERNARIEGSILGHHVTVGEGARVCDLSVIGDRCVLRPGLELSGARVSETDL